MTHSAKKVFDTSLFKRLFKYVKPYKTVFVGSLFLVIGLAVFGAARPYVLQLAIDEQVSQKQYTGFVLLVVVMLVLLLLEVFCNLLFIYYASWLGQTVVKDVRIKLFDHMMSFKMKYYNNSSVGVLITRAVTDMERIADIFGEGLFMIFSDILKMLIVGGVMFYMNWKLSLIVFVTLPIILYATKIFQKYMKRAFEEVRTEVANLNSFVQERVTGMKILQLFSREQTEYEKFKDINKRHTKGWIKTVWYNSIFFPIAEFLSSVTMGAVIWIGGLSVILSDTATIGQLMAFIMFIPMMYRPLNQIANKFNTLQMGMVAADRVFEVLDTQSHIDDNGSANAPRFKGDITFNKVEFEYVPEETVLKGLSFEAKSGQTIAIVGATGAGKSTIINLLSRFYEIKKGEILIDNNNINNFTLESLRQQIAVVLQDVFLFADTIINNITLKDDSITEEQVIKAAKEIGIHDFIMSLPNGYHYNVKERGVMLSSGQKQLIAFLRAYVTNPAILVLDEATSSIDAYSEQLIQKATEKITKNRTSIVIAHRLVTVQNADKILVMDSGELVEEGTHLELIKKPNGYYKNLYEVQFTKVAENLVS